MRRSHLLQSPTFLLSKVILLLTPFIRSLYSHPTGHTVLRIYDDDEPFPLEPVDSAAFWTKLGVSVLLILGGGIFAGLTIGLMGQDIINLQVLAESGDEQERKHAAKVLKLLKRGKHWVLVTLLLSNVLTNETLPIVFDSVLGGGVSAVAISTVSIVIFGEIIPQALCVRYGLAIGAAFVPPMLALMYLMYPIAYPVAKLLDYLLGDDEGTVYKKAGLKTLVTLHKTLGAERLNEDEVTIITAVLDLKEKSVSSIMTPMDDVFTMAADTVLDEAMVDRILKEGYSRIPIYQPGNPTNFVGMLLVKILITYDPEDRQPVSSFTLATLPETRPEVSCLDILNFFQEGKSHMVLISEYPGENHGALGLLTCEDIIEELIGEEILDETDVYIDVHQKTRRMNPPPLKRGRQSTRNVASVGGTTQSNRAVFRPANVASQPRETKSTKVTIKPNAINTSDGKNLTPRKSDAGGYGSIEASYTEGEAVRDNLDSNGPAATSNDAFHDESRPLLLIDKEGGKRSDIFDVHDENDEVGELTIREFGPGSHTHSTKARQTSKVRSGSIVETTFQTHDGTKKVVVETDHSVDEEAIEDGEVRKNGIKIVRKEKDDTDIEVVERRESRDEEAGQSRSDEDSPLMEGSKPKKKKKPSKNFFRR